MTDMLHDYLIIDGSEGFPDEFDYYAALQRQINSGLVWKMQGSAGRAAMDAISAGRCLCGFEPRQDYWGNWVPARNTVLAGTKGSPDFMVERSGVAWAARMAAIDAPVVSA